MPANLQHPFSPSCCDGTPTDTCILNDGTQSAQSCGCDPGLPWTCERHRLEAIITQLQTQLDQSAQLIQDLKVQNRLLLEAAQTFLDPDEEHLDDEVDTNEYD